MEQRGIRDEIVLATKYTTDFRRGKPGQHSSFVGNSVKSMHTSVTASLKKLRTDYIDILYVHWVSRALAVSVSYPTRSAYRCPRSGTGTRPWRRS